MSGALIDANLLCLLSIGSTDPKAIRSHPRLKAFDWGDYLNLIGILDRIGDLVLCPHVLAETSNLIGFRQPPAQTLRFRAALSAIIEKCAERSMAARLAIEDRSFSRLGLADAVLLMLASDPLLRLVSVDLALCQEAERRGLRAINYAYVKDGALRINQIE